MISSQITPTGWKISLSTTYGHIVSLMPARTSSASGDNYVFFCALYNAYKVLLTCYMDGKGEEDFVKAVSSFDDALRQSGDDLIWKMVLAHQERKAKPTTVIWLPSF